MYGSCTQNAGYGFSCIRRNSSDTGGRALPRYEQPHGQRLGAFFKRKQLYPFVCSEYVCRNHIYYNHLSYDKKMVVKTDAYIRVTLYSKDHTNQAFCHLCVVLVLYSRQSDFFSITSPTTFYQIVPCLNCI